MAPAQDYHSTFLLDAITGEPIRAFSASGRSIGPDASAFAFVPAGDQVLLGGASHSTRLVNADSRAVARRFAPSKSATFPLPDNTVRSIAVSPDGQRVLTATWNHSSALLWDVATGDSVLEFAGNAPAGFSPDGRYVVTAGDSAIKAIRLWDATTGEQVRQFEGIPERIESFAFSPTGDHLLVATGDALARLFDVRTGRFLASLISFANGEWAVVAPDGRYDASNGGDIAGLHWVVGLEPIGLEQLKERFYEPGLLGKLMGFNPEPLRDGSAFDAVALFPEVTLERPTDDAARVEVRLRNRGGGIGRVVVWLNGREVASDARPAGADRDADSLVISLDVSGSPYLVPGGPNEVEVRAFNREEYLASRAVGVGLQARTDSTAASPHLWAVVAGVSDYAGDALDLRYAGKDAADVAEALRVAGERLFGGERTHVTLLSTERSQAAPARPTRAALNAILGAIADSAAAGDVLVVYLSGHGVVHGGSSGDYFYLTSDARSANLEDPAVRSAVALSSLELTELLKAIPALKQVLILDTCGAARAVEALAAKRDVPSNQIRAIQRLKDRTGTFVLAGSAADAVSYEASRYAQGVLTYSLLMGLKGAALRDGEFVDVSTLFSFAVDRVPELAHDIGGIQRPEIATPRSGQSFDIGRLTDDDRANIELAEPHPLILRASFQDETRIVDHLGLSRAVNDALRSADAGAAVFVDVDDFPGAFSIVGRYRVAAGNVRVSGYVFRGDRQVAAFEVSGQLDGLNGLAERIRITAEALIAQRPPTPNTLP
jgi:Caspase domain